MSSYTFKNMLIIERATTHGVGDIIKNTPGVWFDSNTSGFQHESPNDKVIIFYGLADTDVPTISVVREGWVPSSPIIGYVHILSSITKLKVIKCKFSVQNAVSRELTTLWQYLVESIKLSGIKDVEMANFVLYWDQLDATIMSKAMESGLLTDRTTMSHTYTTSEVKTGVPTPALPIATAGGMFNTVPQSSPASLFSSVTTPVANVPCGIFSSSTTPVPTNMSGMFGATTTPVPTTTGGMFGTTTTQVPTGMATTTQVPTGMATTTPVPTTTGGIFGANTTPVPTTTGGIFGATTTPVPTTTGGTFGATTTPACGMFGATPGVFSSTPTQTAMGGMFSTTPTPASTGVFGVSGGVFNIGTGFNKGSIFTRK